MDRRIFWGVFCLLFSPLSGMLIGNPAGPGLLECSVFPTKPYWWSFRVGYLDDWIYQQHCQDEFQFEGIARAQTDIRLSTYAALLTLNIKNWVDVYGIVGSSRMQIDREIFTKRALGWGVGGKLILFKYGNLFLGADVKYFETDQKPRYFVVDGLPFNIVSNYRLQYRDIQAALGLSYRAWIFAPYAHATYIDTQIEPKPAKLDVRFPDSDTITDVESKSIVGKKKWGLALGLTLAACKKVSLAFEWRAFNQNAIDVNGEIRF